MDTSEPVRRPPVDSLSEAPDATAVVVNYNSGDRLGPLLDLLTPEVRAAVVVDNASTDGSLAAALDRPNTDVVHNGSNRGFGAAANQGAALAATAWIVFVNPDAHVSPGDVTGLLARLPTDVAAVAPLQVDDHDRPRAETGGYEPSLGRYLVWALMPVRFHRRFGPWLAPPFPEADMAVDWVSGALLGVRRNVFEDLSGFDERFFMYHEDVDLCRRARERGYRIVCRPAVRLHHEVAHGDPARRVLSGQRTIESLAKQFDGWRRRALGLILGLGFGLRALLASGTTRDLARAALPSCGRMIRGELPARAVGPTG